MFIPFAAETEILEGSSSEAKPLKVTNCRPTESDLDAIRSTCAPLG